MSPFKKGEKSEPSNYRPISLTCILCKVLEHIIASNVVKHLDQHNILYDLQHGFRTKRSCETQLIILMEYMLVNSVDGKLTDIILLDFSNAFDKVNHEKLLMKLHGYGIRQDTLLWIRAFLSNRQQVVIENKCSGSVPVTSGVPQRSVIGPILFLLYINDLPDTLKSKVRLFADDTAVYIAVSSLEDAATLQRDLDRLCLWEDEWDMEFNPDKCTVIQVTRSKTPIPSSYVLHGRVLDVVPSAKYLGVNISNNLTWTDHIQNGSTSGNRTHAKTGIDKLERVQRRAARWVNNDYSFQSSVTTLDKLNWRPLQYRRDDARIVLFYKIVYGLVAIPMPPYIVHPLKQTRLSHPLAFRQIHTSVDYYKFLFFPLAVWQWNHLPASIVMLPTLNAFKLAVCNVSHKTP